MQTNTQNDYQAKQSMLQSLAQALQAAHPYLMPSNGLVSAAKNIRTELKRAYPATKFGVRSDRFAGGDAIRIEWIDGPTSDDVSSISHKYEAGRFDGMTDCYDYKHDSWTTAFGDAKYITTRREYSDAFINEAICAIGAKWHDGQLPSVDDFRKGRLYSTSPDRHCDDWQHMIYEFMSKVAK